VTRPAFGLNRWDWSTPTAFADDVARAELLGWDWAFTPVNPLGIWDPYVMLALAAERTQRIGLGTLLENPVLDSPASAAKSISTVDQLSGGRALLGYGVGDTAVRDQNLEPATVAQLERATAHARRWLRSEGVDVGLDEPARMANARPVPVWIAAGGPRTLRMAGRVADGVFVRVGTHPANLRHAIEQVHEGASEAGRDPESIGLGLIFHTVVPDDAESVAAISRSMAAGYFEYSPRLFSIPGFSWDGPSVEDLKREVKPDFHHTADLVAAGHAVSFLPDEIASAFSLCGGAAAMAAQIDAAIACVGPRVDIVLPHPVPNPVPGRPVARQVPAALVDADYIRWFASEVIPLVGSARS
jgi:5,10-methylenetetrahydromethanopterin reductase